MHVRTGTIGGLLLTVDWTDAVEDRDNCGAVVNSDETFCSI